LNWLVGFYYFEEGAENDNLVILTPPVGSILGGGLVDNDSFAAFAQATYSVTDQLELTGGIRYTDETKRYDPYLFVPPGATYSTPGGILLMEGDRLVPEGEVEQTFDDVSFMANVAYDLSDNAMVYVNFSQGFKSGGYDQRFNDIFPAVTNFLPESATAYEIGLKSSFLENTFRLNASAFFTDYEDLQIIGREGFAPVTFNAGEAEIKGFEIEATLVPTDSWLLQAGIGGIDGKYTELGPEILMTTPITLDSELAQTPELTANLTIAYNKQLSWGEITPRVDLVYRGDSFQDAYNSTLISQDAYTLLNASVGFSFADDRLELVVSGRNLTDEVYIVAGTDSTVNSALGFSEGNFARPRTWSISLTGHF
ncbi:MAG: TonB-dependent receptor, partial [Planctomycetota bacterium]